MLHYWYSVIILISKTIYTKATYVLKSFNEWMLSKMLLCSKILNINTCIPAATKENWLRNCLDYLDCCNIWPAVGSLLAEIDHISMKTCDI